MSKLQILLFVEDSGHEGVLTALINRLAAERGIRVDIEPRSVIGGHGQAIASLKRYIRDVVTGDAPLPEVLVVAIDSNCKGLAARRREIEQVVPSAVIPPERLVLAIPDPHVERWLLLDSSAVKAVLGKGCPAPDNKCDRDRYKQQLAQAVRGAGVEPLLGGIEYAEDIVTAMDLGRLELSDASLGATIRQLRRAMQR